VQKGKLVIDIHHGRTRLVALLGAIAVVLGAVQFGVGMLPQAVAETSATNTYLQLEKSVSSKELNPGDGFTYKLVVGCDQQNCENAKLVDVLPPEFAGFSVIETTVTPSGPTITWTDGGVDSQTPPAVLGNDTKLTVIPNETFGDDQTGMLAGTSFEVLIKLSVPSDIANDSPAANKDVTNTATVTADNSLPVESSATTKVVVPETLGVSTTKKWEPETMTYKEGQTSTISLSATNTSTTPVDSIEIDEPSNLKAVASSDPFEMVDLADGWTCTLPKGADAVTVDVLKTDGTWATGVAATSCGLPAGITPADVAGLRITFTSKTGIAVGATASVSLPVTQRSTGRFDSDDFSTGTHTMHNESRAVAKLGTEMSKPVTAKADHKVSSSDLATTLTKAFGAYDIDAGGSTTATLTAKNTGGTVDTFSVTDASGFFGADATFTGFLPITYPEGATAGKVVYTLADGTTSKVTFSNGGTPAVPAGTVVSFTVTFTGTIPTGANTRIQMNVSVPATTAPGTLVNKATDEVSKGDDSATANAQAQLVIDKPGFDIDLKKTVSPLGSSSRPVYAGDEVVADLEAKTTISDDNHNKTDVVITDSKDDLAPDGSANSFWDGFDLTAFGPVDVLANSTLTVKIQTASGWLELTSVAAGNSATQLSMSANQITDFLTKNGLTTDDVIGIQFLFHDDNGFPGTTQFAAATTFTARHTVRGDAGTPTAVAPNPGESAVPSTYQNVAIADGTSGDLTGSVTATAPGKIVAWPVGSTMHAVKSFNSATSSDGEAAVSPLSNGTVSSKQAVSLPSGLKSLVVTDIVNPEGTAIQDSFFNAFNLTAVGAAACSDQQDTNGWALKYDKITKIELYNGSQWVQVATPGVGCGDNADYQLSADQQANTTGVRITLEPDDAARQTAIENGVSNVPGVGTGLVPATDAMPRAFTLNWTVRSQARADGSWVTGSVDYNTLLDGNGREKGSVYNSVDFTGTYPDNTTIDDQAEAAIRIVDLPPAVTLTGGFDPINMRVPQSGDYPSTVLDLYAQNRASTNASYLRITEPALDNGTDAGNLNENSVAGALSNPFAAIGSDDTWRLLGTGSLFDRLDITGISVGCRQDSNCDGVDFANTKIWLAFATKDPVTSKYVISSKGFSYSELATANIDWPDVVGVSATYVPTNPSGAGVFDSVQHQVNLQLQTQLRTNFRLSGDPQYPGVAEIPDWLNVSGAAYAQSYDPIAWGKDRSGAGTRGVVWIDLQKGTLDVKPVKSFSTDSITSGDADKPVTVTLTANQGVSDLAPTSVELSDPGHNSAKTPAKNDPNAGFWNAFQFNGLDSNAISFSDDDYLVSEGVAKVSLCVYGPFDSTTDGWKCSPASTQPTLPVAADQYSQIHGVKAVFTSASGNTLPLKWSAKFAFTVKLRPTDGTFEGKAINWVEATATDGVSTVLKGASDSITWTDGSHILGLNKATSERIVEPGDATTATSLPWDLTFSNEGTGTISVTSLTDPLPTGLNYVRVPSGDNAGADYEVVKHFVPDGGTSKLSETPTFAIDGDNNITLTWPSGTNLLLPGESMTLRFYTWLSIGVYADGAEIKNTFTVHTGNDLEDAENTVKGKGVSFSTSDPKQASAWDNTTVSAPDALKETIGVVGRTGTAYNENHPTTECKPLLTKPGESEPRFFTNPCVSRTTLNADDEWLLHAVNSGPTPISDATLFWELPVAGDTMIVDGAQRESTFRPRLEKDTLQVQLLSNGDPISDTSYSVEVSTTPQACQGAWNELTGNSEAVPCTAAGSQWTPLKNFKSWDNATALRLTVTFSDDYPLPSGGTIDVSYKTKDIDDDLLDGSAVQQAPAQPGATPTPHTEFAFTQYGTSYRYVQQQNHKRIAPSKVGVVLLADTLTPLTPSPTNPIIDAGGGDCWVDGHWCDESDSSGAGVPKTGSVGDNRTARLVGGGLAALGLIGGLGLVVVEIRRRRQNDSSAARADRLA
jgi:hypothetical protein